MKTREDKLKEIEEYKKKGYDYQKVDNYMCPKCHSYNSSFSFNIGNDYVCNDCGATY